MLNDYLIIDKQILPDYFQKVVDARNLLESGKIREVSEAVKVVGISRSTYYKYKDYILSPADVSIGRKAVISMLLSHEKGVLSRILNLLSSFSANILTITQSLPINQKACVTITLDISDMSLPIRDLLGVIENTGVAESLKLEAIE